MNAWDDGSVTSFEQGYAYPEFPETTYGDLADVDVVSPRGVRCG